MCGLLEAGLDRSEPDVCPDDVHFPGSNARPRMAVLRRQRYLPQPGAADRGARGVRGWLDYGRNERGQRVEIIQSDGCHGVQHRPRQGPGWRQLRRDRFLSGRGGERGLYVFVPTNHAGPDELVGYVRERTINNEVAIPLAELEVIGGPDNGRKIQANTGGFFRLGGLRGPGFDLIVRAPAYNSKR